MKNLLGKRRRASDELHSGNPSHQLAQPHPLFSGALDKLPQARWAVACNAGFRADGDVGLRGILHHDGAILRFTTWGGTERFAAAPMEFQWEQTPGGCFHIVHGETNVRLSRLGPLSSFVANPPTFAAAEDERLAESLARWMTTWAPAQSSPLASPM